MIPRPIPVPPRGYQIPARIISGRQTAPLAAIIISSGKNGADAEDEVWCKGWAETGIEVRKVKNKLGKIENIHNIIDPNHELYSNIAIATLNYNHDKTWY